MTPPQRLRQELEGLRRRGFTFRQAWPVALSAAVRELPRRDAVWWRQTFGEQRDVWAVSYSRAPWPAKGPTLALTDREHRKRENVALLA